MNELTNERTNKEKKINELKLNENFIYKKLIICTLSIISLSTILYLLHNYKRINNKIIFVFVFIFGC